MSSNNARSFLDTNRIIFEKFSDLQKIFAKMRTRGEIKCLETPSKIVQQVGKKSSLVGSAGASSGAHTAHHLDAVPMSTPCINVPKRNDVTDKFEFIIIIIISKH